MNTICAISTPPGNGGIAVIRISGENAFAMAEQLTGRTLTHRLHYCLIPDLDDVVVTTYHAPHSYTGEDVVEISCHGSLYIQQMILHRLVDLGCSMARPGEFTQRAFINGKMDLSQAEAVADLIASRSKADHDLALHHLRGGISSSLQTMRQDLLTLTSLLELELDFADHEQLEFADRDQLITLCHTIRTHLTTLIDSFKAGNAIRQGIGVAIIGATNVGKSTLLNALLGEERAIVSSIEGTTRDTIEDTMVLDGYLFRLFDTAGLRTTHDEIEKMGIERTHRVAEMADIIIYVHDATSPDTAPCQQVWSDKPVLHIINKVDLLPSEKLNKSDHALYMSARSGDVKELCAQLVHYAQQMCTSTGSVTISNARHYEALVRARQAIEQVENGIETKLSSELVAMDLRDCLNALGEITGQITSNEVLANIFSHFCIGK